MLPLLLLDGDAEHGHLAVVLDAAHLAVVGDVAEHEVAALGVPRRALGPQRPGPEALNRGVRLREAIERRIDRDHVRIPEIDVRHVEIARRAADHARRRHGSHRVGGARHPGTDRERARAQTRRADLAEKTTPVEAAVMRLAAVDLLLLLLPKHLLLPPWLNTDHLCCGWCLRADGGRPRMSHSSCPMRRWRRIRDVLSVGRGLPTSRGPGVFVRDGIV